VTALVPSFQIEGRRVVVTGAASGLGRAFTLALAGIGASVTAIDLDAAGLAETGRLAGSSGLELSLIEADLSDAGEVERAVRELDSTEIDVLINNAGIASMPGRMHEISIEDWDRVMQANLRSMFLMTRALLPPMLVRRSGSIINMSSFLGLVGVYPGFAITASPYACSKAGVVGLTRQIAIEYAAEGIRANAIAPGWHGGTKLGRERRAVATAEETRRFEQFIAASVPMGHRGTAEDLCGLVLYLASDASRYVTGQVFAHDGGLTAS
jgi:NAD(P)-dependent dehydrogenase (short-subunit alcohol dehydrogenase family)